jgi:hypothetical protein
MKIHKNVVKGALAFLAASSLLGMGLAPAQAVDANTVTIWMDADSQGALKNTVNTEATKLGITITLMIICMRVCGSMRLSVLMCENVKVCNSVYVCVCMYVLCYYY